MYSVTVSSLRATSSEVAARRRVWRLVGVFLATYVSIFCSRLSGSMTPCGDCSRCAGIDDGAGSFLPDTSSFFKFGDAMRDKSATATARRIKAAAARRQRVKLRERAGAEI